MLPIKQNYFSIVYTNVISYWNSETPDVRKQTKMAFFKHLVIIIIIIIKDVLKSELANF